MDNTKCFEIQYQYLCIIHYNCCVFRKYVNVIATIFLDFFLVSSNN